MPKVTITTDNKTIEVDEGSELLDICDEHDTSLAYGCRGGACGACLIQITSGADAVSKMQDIERETLESIAAEPNERLACQCKVYGDITIEVSG